MCQEIHIDDVEVLQADQSCWCPLLDEQSLHHKVALQELGRLVMEKLRAIQKVNPDQPTVDITITLRRW
jgi:hypothetical protein